MILIFCFPASHHSVREGNDFFLSHHAGQKAATVSVNALLCRISQFKCQMPPTGGVPELEKALAIS